MSLGFVCEDICQEDAGVTPRTHLPRDGGNRHLLKRNGEFAGAQGDTLLWQRSLLGWEQGKLLQGQMYNKFSVGVKLSSLAGGKGITDPEGSKAYIDPWRWGRAGLCWRKAPWARRTQICTGFRGRVVWEGMCSRANTW